ncbi:winged helix-turn-helix domain-containing protein [Methanolobus mangrovi]|uniref:Winged helix-turn-helix domain-containing protein n=1 Tax=Methanolobus mangrovi TaxID=3072977 RepID=A0AA51YGT1_9EURY|nr:winged helix-turn-helix domain-containing protein [Methanolobus mangrovi]WMW22411.1 winged helix-turn-helix domain-containing protein [Methanolobus mangrovi]
MKKRLLDVAFASDKRKNVLLFLQEGAKEMDTLLELLDTIRQALLPQMKILEEHYLVFHYDDKYELTTIGKLVVDEMVPLLNTVELFGNDIDYWGTRDLNCIPHHLISRISEIGKSKVISISPTEQYDVRSTHHEKSTECKFHSVVTTILYPNYHDIFSYLIENNIKIDLIVSESLLKKICTDHHVNFENYMKTDVVNIYVYNKKMDFLFFSYDEFYTNLCLLRNNGEFDSKFILFDNKNALKWGKDFFDYYLENSTPITEL